LPRRKWDREETGVCLTEWVVSKPRHLAAYDSLFCKMKETYV